MRRVVQLVSVAGVSVLGAVLLFWLAMPSVNSVSPTSATRDAVERAERSDIGHPPPAARPRPGPGSRSDPTYVDTTRTPSVLKRPGGPPVDLLGGSAKNVGTEKGAMRRLKAGLAQLESIEIREIDPNASPQEQDLEIAMPIRNKDALLARMTSDVSALLELEEDPRAARGLIVLADAHEHMAKFLLDAPAPPYLAEDDLPAYRGVLEQRAEDQELLAEAMREQARSLE